MSLAITVTRAIEAVCPVHGVSIGRRNNKSTWRIDFKSEATSPQRAAAQAILASYDELDATRAEKWAEIKAARDIARDAGYPFMGKKIQSDAVSRCNISGAALAAQFAKAAAQPYEIEWTCADNTIVTLNADQVIAMFAAGAAAMQAVYTRGVELRERINAATTEAEIAAIAW